MAQLRTDNVRKSFGKVDVQKGVGLDIADGEFIVLLGPSGCGKSTMLRIIAGLEDQTSGPNSIGGEVIDHLPPARRGIAMVFQNYARYPHLDVAGNWASGLQQAGTAEGMIDQRIEEAAHILELGALLDRRPSEVSGGQRQRVATGRAIVRHRGVFLLDEPLSNLDAALRAQVRFEIGRQHNDLGVTMVYVTQDQVEAMTLADRIVVMHEGMVQKVGSPSDLYRRPANLFVAGCVGAPKMNFLEGRAAEAGRVDLARGGDLPIVELQQPLGNVVLGVRPDGFALGSNETAPVSGKVVLNEYLGRESYLHLALEEGSRIVVEVSAENEVRLGEVVGLELKPKAAHLFDAGTEQRLAG